MVDNGSHKKLYYVHNEKTNYEQLKRLRVTRQRLSTGDVVTTSSTFTHTHIIKENI